METQKMNLFIVDDDKLVVSDLKIYLNYKFGTDINISTFSDGESCLEKVDKNTNLVILDYMLNGKNGLEVLKLIKEINPKTEVIMLSSNEDIALAIQSFRNGASDYVIKGQGALKKISQLVYNVVTAPIRIIIREFGVSKYMAIFFLTFIVMGIVVASVLFSMK
jgi:DNA-binding NarL/FixJ family response regulator